MIKIIFVFIALISATHSTIAGNIDSNTMPENKRTKAGFYLDSKGAYDLMQKQAGKSLFIDVRTRAEVAFVGMPDIVDANVPFKYLSKKYKWDEKRQNFKMKSNPNFIVEVISRLSQKGLTKDNKVLVMCRSGGRSAGAADLLTAAGFKQVYSVIDGFEGDAAKTGVQKGKRIINGWKNSQLPWSFSLDKNKMDLSGKTKGKMGKSKKMLKKMDANNDGMISRDEFDRQHEKKFGKMDRNKDGVLDTKELEQSRKTSKREKMKAKYR